MKAIYAASIGTFILLANLSYGAIPFLKQMDSPFPSGIEDRSLLEKKIVDTFSNNYHFIKTKDQGEAWFLEEEVFGWKQLASELRCKTKAAFYSGRNQKLEPMAFCKKGEVLNSLEYQNSRFRVKTQKQRTFWIDSKDVEWLPKHLGKAVLKEDSYLKDLKRGNKIWLQTPVKLNIVRYHKDKLFVSFSDSIYMAKREQFITPLDIATGIQFNSGKVYPFEIKSSKIRVRKKNFAIPAKPKLVFDSHRFAALKGTPLYHFTGTQFLSAKKLESTNIFFSLRFKEENWFQSKVKNHGLVYWRDYKHIVTSEVLTDELFYERKLYDMASSPLDRKIIFASAGGVFRKISDNQWEPIAKFSGKDYPIHFSKSGRLFIGPYKSDDHGEHFESYLAFHKLLGKLKAKHLRLENATYKITKIKSLDKKGDVVLLTLSGGTNKISVKADLETGSFQILN